MQCRVGIRATASLIDRAVSLVLQSGSTGGLGPGDADGVQSGIQSELNREQLRSAQTALSVSNSRSRPSWSANTSSQTLATTSLDGSTRLTPARSANTAHLERRLRSATRRVAEANSCSSGAMARAMLSNETTSSRPSDVRWKESAPSLTLSGGKDLSLMQRAVTRRKTRMASDAGRQPPGPSLRAPGSGERLVH